MKLFFIKLGILILSSNFLFSQNVNQVIDYTAKALKGEPVVNRGDFWLGTSYAIPINTQSITDNKEKVVNPIQIFLEGAVSKNISFGLLGGYTQYSTKAYNWDGGYENIANEIACDAGLGDILGLDCSKETGSYTYNVKQLMIGGSAHLHIPLDKKISLTPGITAGYKIFLNKVNGEKPSNTLGLSSLLEDNVESTIENVTKIFYLPHLGLSYRISKPLSVKLEGGYGIGFGDGIAFTENTLVFNLGLLWHFHHSKISKQNPSN